MEIKTVARFRLSFSVPTKKDPVVFQHVAIAPNMFLFCAASNVGNLYVGDIVRDKVTALYELGSPISALALMQRASGNVVALVLSTIGSFTVVDIDSGSVIGFHPGDGDVSYYISIHPTADRVITTGTSSSGTVWKIDDEGLVRFQRLAINDDVHLFRSQFSFDGNSIITWMTDGRIIIWDFPSLQFLRQLPAPSAAERDSLIPLVSTTLSRDGQLLAAIGQMAKLIIWEMAKDADPVLIDLPDEFANSLSMEFLVSSHEFINIIFLGKDGLLRMYNPIVKMKVKVKRSSKVERKYTRLVVQHEGNRSLMSAICIDGSLDLLCVVSTKTNRIKLKNGVSQPIERNLPSPKLDSPKIKIDLVDAPKPTWPDSITIKTLENMLRDFKVFPAKHRSTIWNHLLRLPRNQEAYQSIMNRGLHPAFEKLEKTFDVIDVKLFGKLKKILSAVCHWCSLLSEVVYLPLLVFPFVKVFNDDLFTCFEVIVTCLTNWCHDWFEYYPAPPLLVLADVDLMLADACPSLLDHFKAKHITAEIYAWPLFRSLLSEVFTEDEWLCVWDHLVLYKDQCAFFTAIVASYAIVSQNSLLKCQEEDDFKRYFRDKNPVPIKILLKSARQLVEGNFKVHDHRRLFTALPTQTYPIFYNFPRVAIEHHAREQSNIRRLEIDYENQKKATIEAELIHGTVLQLEAEMKRRDAIEKAAQVIRKQHILHEEQRLADERFRLKTMTAELRKRELVALEANRRRLNRNKQIIDEGSQVDDNIDGILRWGTAQRMAERKDAADIASTRYHQLLTNNYRQENTATQYSLQLKEAKSRLANAIFNNVNTNENQQQLNMNEKSSTVSTETSVDYLRLLQARKTSTDSKQKISTK